MFNHISFIRERQMVGSRRTHGLKVKQEVGLACLYHAGPIHAPARIAVRHSSLSTR